ncbi:DsbA family protein [Anianabacter salinae]|uniref:DsbA family protein n=1 Tax=Anianabacter salinae TaxID=2851023 RepID=UPI00225E5D2D|nr:DsbA family protein [Anianabacter salinae]MBV0913645.1 DsbA family protein [Anianabacter salinae]
MNRLLATAAAVVAIGAGAYFVMGNTSGTSEFTPISAANAQDIPAELAAIDTSSVEQFTKGAEDAPVTLIEYASFTCPHCANFHNGALKQIEENYIDTGKVKLEYREVYFDRYGLWAAMVARCGGEMRYFGLVDEIYAKQRDWLDAADEEGIQNNLRTIGKTAGLSDAELDVCLSDQAKAELMIAKYQQNVYADGIEATPSFVIDGTTYKNMSYEDMAELLNAELAEAE